MIMTFFLKSMLSFFQQEKTCRKNGKFRAPGHLGTLSGVPKVLQRRSVSERVSYTFSQGPLFLGKLLCPISIISIWVSDGLVKCDFYFIKHFSVIDSILITLFGWCSGQHSFILCRRPEFNYPIGPTNFQLSFFSFSSLRGHQTFLLKTSNLRKNHFFKCREKRVISHIMGLP